MEDVHEAAREVGRALTDALGEDLVALYLHGSAVLGGFLWERSDLDLLALSRKELSDQQFGRVVGALVPLRYPGNGLEFTVMTAGEASQPALPAPRFQLHLTTGGWHAVRNVVDGRPREGDRDLVLHLAVCRGHGEAIVGPPARSLLAALPEEAIVSAMRDEIAWARAHGPLEYLVLTAARAWLFSSTHRIASKIEAGLWAAAHDAEPAVIEAALARQRGVAVAIPTDAAEGFAERVERLTWRPQASECRDALDATDGRADGPDMGTSVTSRSVRRAEPGDYEAVSLLNREVQRLHADAYPDLFKPPSDETMCRAAYDDLL